MMAMAMAIHEAPDLDFQEYSTTTTTATTANDCNWNNWAPVVDWDVISGSARQDDFHGLIESMIVGADHDCGVGEGLVGMEDGYCCNSESNDSMAVDEEITVADDGGDLKGLRLVHLLMAAAEALTGANKSHELARVILVRLKELVSPTNGSNMERLTAHFTEALQRLLDGASSKHHHHHHHHVAIRGEAHHQEDHHPIDAIAAFQLLQDMSPYVKFGHFTANQAILEAVIGYRRVHVVDYDIMEGVQWASLMQALVSKKDSLPAPHLRITALSRGSGGRKSISKVQETGRRLAAFAASIGLSFSFHQCRLDSDETFRPSSLKLARGEALIFNCMPHLTRFSHQAPHSVASFLSGARTLNPRLLTLAEEETGCNTGDVGFVGQFMDSLHHYSAIYDSLEAGFPMQGQSRALVERIFLGPSIASSLARIYQSQGEGDSGSSSWGKWLGEGGFVPAKISFSNHCQAKLLVGLFNDGYRVEELEDDRLVLSWKSRRLLSASVWVSCSSSSPSFSSDSES